MKKYVSIIILLFIIVLPAGCTNNYPQPQVWYDTQIAQEFFPNLDGIISVAIEAVPLTDSGVAPGPSDIKYCGFIELDYAVSDKYWEEYEWTKVDIETYTENIVTNMNSKPQWHYSKDFRNDIIPEKYLGDIYLYDNVLWFEIMTY